MFGWELLENVTTGPWYVDVGALAGGAGALFWLYRNIVAPTARAFWAAIIAAPKIAIYTGRLVELLEQDVIERLDAGNIRFQKIEEGFAALGERVTALETGAGARVLTSETHVTRTVTEPAVAAQDASKQ